MTTLKIEKINKTNDRFVKINKQLNIDVLMNKAFRNTLSKLVELEIDAKKAIKLIENIEMIFDFRYQVVQTAENNTFLNKINCEDYRNNADFLNEIYYNKVFNIVEDMFYKKNKDNYSKMLNIQEEVFYILEQEYKDIIFDEDEDMIIKICKDIIKDEREDSKEDVSEYYKNKFNISIYDILKYV